MRLYSFINRKKRGMAMPMALLVMILLIILGMGLLALGHQSQLQAIRATREIAARIAADSGIAKAIYQMNQQIKVKPWNDSSLPAEDDQSLPNFDGVFSYTVTGNTTDGYTIRSVGTFNGVQKTIEVVLRLQSPFGEFALFTNGDIEMKAGSDFNWYNNDADDESFQIGTNSIESGAVALKNDSSLFGDIVVGVGGDPSVVVNDQGANITGDLGSLSQKFILDSVTVPAWLAAMGSSGTIDNDATISSSGKYSEINLGNSEEIDIEGDVVLYVTGDVLLGNDAEITVKEDSSLTLYIGGSLIGDYGSSFNNETEIPRNFQILGLDSSSDMRFKNSSEFFGVIYAPLATVQFDNSAAAYGAVICDEFEQKNSAAFNYDASLREITHDDELVQFTTSRWKEY